MFSSWTICPIGEKQEVGMRMLIFALVFCLVGCNESGGGGGSSSSSCDKGIISNWFLKSDSNVNFDFSASSFDEQSAYSIVFGDGAECNLDLTIQGSTCSGSLVSENSSYVGGGSGDPGCSYFNQTFSYSISGETATFCDEGATSDDDCSDYE
jgi:hypothetical protein